MEPARFSDMRRGAWDIHHRIRDMDIAAEIIGVDPLKAKLTAFAVSSFYIGIAGALFFAVYLGAAEVGEAFEVTDRPYHSKPDHVVSSSADSFCKALQSPYTSFLAASNN